MLGWQKPHRSNASKAGKSKEHKLTSPKDKYTFQIWDTQTKALLGYCNSDEMSKAIKYARKAYPDKSTFVCRDLE